MHTFLKGLAAIYTGGEAGTIYDPYAPVPYGTNPTPKPNDGLNYRWTGYEWVKCNN